VLFDKLALNKLDCCHLQKLHNNFAPFMKYFSLLPPSKLREHVPFPMGIEAPLYITSYICSRQTDISSYQGQPSNIIAAPLLLVFLYFFHIWSSGPTDLFTTGRTTTHLTH